MRMRNSRACTKSMAGFECEFVELPPNVIQTECPICLLVLREPYQATCCGKSFCKECIESVKVRNNSCPTCKAEDFFSYPNLGLQQSLYDFRVYCTHKSKGCEWIGELRELNNHLNSDPPADKSLEGCPFTLINCPLSSAGCEEKLPRDDMKSHVNNDVFDHFLKQASQVNALKEQLVSYQKDLLQVSRDKEHFQERVFRLEGRLGALRENREVPPGLVTFIVTDYQQHKINDDKWYSKPFYSHPQGYRMYLEVVANRYATSKGTNLSVYIHLKRGEFDCSLKWPFRGEVTIHLLNQNEEGHYYAKTVTYSDDIDDEKAARVTGLSLQSKGHGFRKFISHAELEQSYVKNDCIKLRIQNVTPK